MGNRVTFCGGIRGERGEEHPLYYLVHIRGSPAALMASNGNPKGKLISRIVRFGDALALFDTVRVMRIAWDRGRGRGPPGGNRWAPGHIGGVHRPSPNWAILSLIFIQTALELSSIGSELSISLLGDEAFENHALALEELGFLSCRKLPVTSARVQFQGS